MIERFQAAMAGLESMALVTSDPAGALVATLRERGVTEVIAWADPVLEQYGIPQAARGVGIEWFTSSTERTPAEVRAVAARAGAGITTADWAVAETGTLVLLSGPGRPRTANVLPPLHVAVVPLERLRPDTAALFRELSALAGGKGMPSGMHMVTGPSRSADIEDVLVRKVHGPGELIVLLVP
ncbi:MAG TPA: lactate utilization protein [Symbiobacteriaceae bacterium]|nr:lactate utilization protein [Symbiobacteriaceae bacterium]